MEPPCANARPARGLACDREVARRVLGDDKPEQRQRSDGLFTGGCAKLTIARNRVAGFGEMREILRLLNPKLADLAGFAKHRAPFLADKNDLSNLKSALDTEIAKRPTRRQSITDVALIVGLIAGLLAIGAHLAH